MASGTSRVRVDGVIAAIDRLPEQSLEVACTWSLTIDCSGGLDGPPIGTLVADGQA